MQRYVMEARAEFGQDAWPVERKAENGCWVLHSEAAATIARLQAELAETKATLEWTRKNRDRWQDAATQRHYRAEAAEAERDALTAELKAARERLETDHYYVIQNGELVRCEDDGPLPEDMDGIACRDETIAMLEEHIKAIRTRADLCATPDPRTAALVEALRAADRYLARGHDKMAHNITRAALAAWEA